MSKVLIYEVLNDEIAVSVAQVLASANKKATDLGIDVKNSLITISQHLTENVWHWRVHYGAKDYVGRRGGDLMIDVDANDATIQKVLRGQ